MSTDHLRQQDAQQRIKALEAEVERLRQSEAELTTQLAVAQKLQKITERLPNAIYVFDLDTQSFSYYNTATVKMTGYSLADLETMGSEVLSLSTHPDDMPILEQLIQQVVASSDDETVYAEYRVKHKDGTIYWLNNRATPFCRNDAGQLTQVLGVVSDITVQKQAEAEREDFQRTLIESLSSPILPIAERVIIVPLIGTIDVTRAQNILRALLNGISRNRAKVVIIDITGVDLIDSEVAIYINRAIQAARLKGATTILTGVSDAVAETIIDLGIDWSGIETVSDLQSGIAAAETYLKANHTQL